MLISSLVLAALVATAAPTSSLALTFDDGLAGEGAAHNRAILKALADAKVRSVLFVAGKRVDSPEGLTEVRAWAAGGHLIANHTYSHRNFGAASMTLAEFEADTLRNEALIRDLPGFTRWFRFPMLKEGDTAAKRDGFRAFLRAKGYRSGRVTIDASDWYYDRRFRAWQAAHPGADPQPFRQAYLDHLWGRALYYDALARKVIGRAVKHTLLLHPNAINAAFLPDVIQMFRERKWRLIDARAAYTDPIFARDPEVLPAGESLVWSIAKAKGEGDLRYPGEDEIYEKPILDAAGL